MAATTCETSESQQPEKVIAFVDPRTYGGTRYNEGHVLLASGPGVEFELALQGRDLGEWIIAEVPPDGCSGVMVWEGECANLWCMNHGADWEPRLEGAWRIPTTEELQQLAPSTSNT